MDRVTRSPCQHQVARQVLVSGICLHELVRIHGTENELARHEATLEAEVDVVRPQDPTSADALPDEGDWYVGESPRVLRHVRSLPLSDQHV